LSADKNTSTFFVLAVSRIYFSWFTCVFICTRKNCTCVFMYFSWFYAWRL